jgi:hypothetical protein
MIPQCWRWPRNANGYSFSHDVGTMPAHFRAFRTAGERSSGVFLIAQSLDVATAIDELLLIWLASEASEWENRLVWLPL